LTIEELLKDADCFKIPPGGEMMAAPRFKHKSKDQNKIFK